VAPVAMAVREGAFFVMLRGRESFIGDLVSSGVQRASDACEPL